jgi:diacylglycerol kinase family enzyme
MDQPDGSCLDFEVRTLMLMVNNGKYGGSHVNFTPGAVVNDGLLDIVIKTGDFGVKSGLNILDEADKQHGKHVFRDDI